MHRAFWVKFCRKHDHFIANCNLVLKIQNITYLNFTEGTYPILIGWVKTAHIVFPRVAYDCS